MVEFKETTEQEIIDKILDGEKSLYAEVIRKFNPYLYKIGRSYSYNHQDTEDLMQETFIAAYKHLAQFEGRSSFKTWITRIMLNNCYKKQKKLSFKNEIQAEIREGADPMYTDRKKETDKMVQNQELKTIIEESLTRIPFDYRMVFALREINAMNTAETAELLNISEANVKVRLNRAKKMLRTDLNKRYSETELFEFNLIYCEPMVERVMEEIERF